MAIRVVNGYAPLSEQRRNVPCDPWFAPLGVPKSSVRSVCAFALRNAPAAKVPFLTPRSEVRVSARVPWLLSDVEIPWLWFFDQLGRRAWRCAESSQKPHLFLAAGD